MHRETSSSGAARQAGVAVGVSDLIRLREEARRIDIAPRGKVLATRSGGHLSRFRGRGIEFDESRPYVPGDDPRSMDWRVTARTGRTHVKCYREERERPVWLLVDLGPSMRFGTRTAFKTVIAAQAAALLAWAAAEKGDRVGGLIYDETRHFERHPAPRTRGVLPLLNALAQRPLAAGRRGYADFDAAAEHLTRLVRPGSLVFLLSDFHQAPGHNTSWLARLAAHSEVTLIEVVDPIELRAPPAGRYPVSDGVRYAFFDTGSAPRRNAYQKYFAEHSERLTALARRHQAHLLRLRTDAPVGSALARGLRPRLNGGHRSGGLP
ncbi:MAG: DUF58 domain-containing protein [Gammaproteobacteria bacterium]